LLPVLRAVRGEGAITLAAIATALNDRKIPTARGARRHVSSVTNLLAREQRHVSRRHDRCRHMGYWRRLRCDPMIFDTAAMVDPNGNEARG
jgi:hypothetical protein